MLSLAVCYLETYFFKITINHFQSHYYLTQILGGSNIYYTPEIYFLEKSIDEVEGSSLVSSR
jgi:hypothetical protein